MISAIIFSLVVGILGLLVGALLGLCFRVHVLVLLLPCEELEIGDGFGAVDPPHRFPKKLCALLNVPDVHLAISVEYTPITAIGFGVRLPA
jgi:hypothetical protein